MAAGCEIIMPIPDQKHIKYISLKACMAQNKDASSSEKLETWGDVDVLNI